MPLSSAHESIRQDLLARQGALRGQLGTRAFADADTQDEVHDWKDVAEEDSRLAVRDVTLAHAAQELAEIVAALRRLDDGSYGTCVDCGEPIDERRLQALPATAVCADCQRVREAG